MLNVPSEIRSNFDKILKKESVPIKYHSHYHKWLRYYLDFCCKYHHPENNEASKLLFVEKLREKNQPVAFQEQAGDAISLYYQIINHRMKPEAVVRDNTISEKIDRPAHDNRKTAPQPAQSFGSTGIPDKPVYDSHKTAPQNVPRNEWRSAYKNLCDEIQVRHYFFLRSRAELPSSEGRNLTSDILTLSFQQLTVALPFFGDRRLTDDTPTLSFPQITG